jgi:hypothetical protein
MWSICCHKKSRESEIKITYCGETMFIPSYPEVLNKRIIGSTNKTKDEVDANYCIKVSEIFTLIYLFFKVFTTFPQYRAKLSSSKMG